MILKFLLLGVWMVLVPLGMGYFALGAAKTKEIKSGSGGRKKLEIGYVFCLGYIVMWAVFQLVAVPFVIQKGKYHKVELIFEILSLTFAIAGGLLFLLHLKYKLWKNPMLCLREFWKRIKDHEELAVVLLWLLFLAGLLFQLMQTYRLAYADGDDAFYIPVSVATGTSNTMYLNDSYSGNPTEINMRYGLAPFPIWVAFIASKCGVNAAVAAQSLIPLVLIPVTYILYLELGKLLCRNVISDEEPKEQMRQKRLLPLFMIFVVLLQIFGNYSIYPASTFLLTRTRQGKAALGNIILPFFILLLYKMAEEVKKQGKAGMQNAFWLMAAMTAGCLCSTMAGFLCSMLIMLTAGLIFVLYKKPYILLQGFLGCVPGIIYALLYLKY